MKASSRRSRLLAEKAKQLAFDESMQVRELVVQTSDRVDSFGPLAGTPEWYALSEATRRKISQKRTKQARAERAADLETGKSKRTRTKW